MSGLGGGSGVPTGSFLLGSLARFRNGMGKPQMNQSIKSMPVSEYMSRVS